MTETVLSQNGVRIRLTDERWVHITEEHAELAGMRLEILDTVEPLAKCSVLAKVKEGEDFNRRNTGRILRIEI